jgi:hypothetical protein
VYKVKRKAQIDFLREENVDTTFQLPPLPLHERFAFGVTIWI